MIGLLNIIVYAKETLVSIHINLLYIQRALKCCKVINDHMVR